MREVQGDKISSMWYILKKRIGYIVFLIAITVAQFSHAGNGYESLLNRCVAKLSGYTAVSLRDKGVDAESTLRHTVPLKYLRKLSDRSTTLGRNVSGFAFGLPPAIVKDNNIVLSESIGRMACIAMIADIFQSRISAYDTDISPERARRIKDALGFERSFANSDGCLNAGDKACVLEAASARMAEAYDQFLELRELKSDVESYSIGAAQILAAYIVYHEMGHVVLDHFSEGEKPIHVQETEADLFALDMLTLSGEPSAVIRNFFQTIAVIAPVINSIDDGYESDECRASVVLVFGELHDAMRSILEVSERGEINPQNGWLTNHVNSPFGFKMQYDASHISETCVSSFESRWHALYEDVVELRAFSAKHSAALTGGVHPRYYPGLRTVSKTFNYFDSFSDELMEITLNTDLAKAVRLEMISFMSGRVLRTNMNTVSPWGPAMISAVDPPELATPRAVTVSLRVAVLVELMHMNAGRMDGSEWASRFEYFASQPRIPDFELGLVIARVSQIRNQCEGVERALGKALLSEMKLMPPDMDLSERFELGKSTSAYIAVSSEIDDTGACGRTKIPMPDRY